MAAAMGFFIGLLPPTGSALFFEILSAARANPTIK
jgi:hypothetical protein